MTTVLVRRDAAVYPCHADEGGVWRCGRCGAGRIPGAPDQGPAPGTACPVCRATVVSDSPSRPGVDWRGPVWLIVFGFIAWMLLRWAFYL